jgi:tRNA-modifying protein YgfZ
MTAPVSPGERAFFDLSTRVKLRLSGADRLRFLNGQLTNDVRKATGTNAVEACVLNAKGKMDAHLFLHANGDSFLLDADSALRSILKARLERYIIADDVQIEDVTSRFSIFHVLGETAPTLVNSARVISTDRSGSQGFDIWIDASEHDELAAELSKTFLYCDENCADVFRIEQGIARWGRELTGEIIPVEANLEQRCIDYEKGCYIGQEIISRMKMSGQRNKQLCGLISVKNVPLNPGARLTVEGKDVGWITSATRSGEREIALAYVKRGFNAVGSKIETISTGSAAVPAEIVDLPFAPSARS